MKLRWTRAATRDLGSIENYISRDNPAAALDTVVKVNRHIGLLAQYPGNRTPRTDQGNARISNFRLPYVVAYRRKGKIVTVMRILHGAMNWPKRF